MLLPQVLRNFYSQTTKTQLPFHHRRGGSSRPSARPIRVTSIVHRSRRISYYFLSCLFKVRLLMLCLPQISPSLARVMNLSYWSCLNIAVDTLLPYAKTSDPASHSQSFPLAIIVACGCANCSSSARRFFPPQQPINLGFGVAPLIPSQQHNHWRVRQQHHGGSQRRRYHAGSHRCRRREQRQQLRSPGRFQAQILHRVREQPEQVCRDDFRDPLCAYPDNDLEDLWSPTFVWHKQITP